MGHIEITFRRGKPKRIVKMGGHPRFVMHTARP